MAIEFPNCQKIIKNKKGIEIIVASKKIDGDEIKNYARLLSYLEGESIENLQDKPKSNHLIQQIGTNTAKFHKHFQKFKNQDYFEEDEVDQNNCWDLKNAQLLLNLIDILNKKFDSNKIEIFKKIITKFSKETAKLLEEEKLEQGIVHVK